MPAVLIVAEVAGEGLAPTTTELASEGRRLADQLGEELVAFVALRNLSGVAGSLGEYGVDRALVSEYGVDGPVSPEWLAEAARHACQMVTPRIVLLTHSTAGRELGPTLAFRLDAGVVTDCTALRLEDGQLVATKPVYGGSAIAEFAFSTTTQVATLRPRAFEAAEPQAGRQAQTESFHLPPPPGRVQVLDEVRTTSGVGGPNLKDARVIVSGGRGLGTPDNWHHVEELAQVLGAAVGATRAVTDAGWVPPALQVGLTGVSVAPDLYIAVGISGAVQHVAGISGARNVVAINRDADANIFKYARFGAVGDWKQILPAFTQRLKELRS